MIISFCCKKCLNRATKSWLIYVIIFGKSKIPFKNLLKRLLIIHFYF